MTRRRRVEAMNDERKMLRDRTVRQINDEWKDWRHPVIQKKHKTGRKISPNDPLRRRWTKMAFNLRLESLPS